MLNRLTKKAAPTLGATVLLVALLPPLSRVAPAVPVPVPPAVRAAAGLPSHFGFGLSAHPDESGIYGWMPDSGIPWDYAYQYLAGGVNTGQGWQTWDTDGQFPLFYAQGAEQNGYIPVLPYYMLLQSDSQCGSCGEAERDLANLNARKTMAAYYRDFTVLMKRLGPDTWDGIQGFGGTAVVHVEPDLSGYAEQAVLDPSRCFSFCTGHGNDPSHMKAKVAASGVANVSAYPDTYQGFNLALLHLRDRFAPNVLLAFHVSDWSTLQDVGSSTDPNLKAKALGRKAGTFAALSGTAQVQADVSTYDLVFNDVADRDAAYYKYVVGRDVFWDRFNVAFPNFHRWEHYVRSVADASGRPVVLWQVPEGNQYYRTESNSDGHYQDNRAEYFFGHVGELIDSGVIAVLFGAGNGGSTVHTDGKGDGVTNPPSFCTTDGVSSGQVCNGHDSSWPDDDGGFIRLSAQTYYTAPVPLP
jgi:hypothetical protein